VKGCYNWQLNVAQTGCYTGISDDTMQNIVLCFCDSNNCNTDDFLNSTPNIPRRYTCEHSTQDSCTVYACTVSFSQVLGGNPIIERGCDTQPFGAFQAKIQLNIGATNILLPFCKESLAYNKSIGFFTKKECTCYENQCNSEENDPKLPQVPEKPVDCLAEWCEGNSSCIKANRDGICKGQYCAVQIAKSREIGSGRPNGWGRTMLRTCGASSSELADTAGTFGVNFTLINSASTMFQDSSVMLCSSGKCNSDPAWETSSAQHENKQPVQTSHKVSQQVVIKTNTNQQTVMNNRRRNSGNNLIPAFLMEIISLILLTFC